MSRGPGSLDAPALASWCAQPPLRDSFLLGRTTTVNRLLAGARSGGYTAKEASRAVHQHTMQAPAVTSSASASAMADILTLLQSPNNEERNRAEQAFNQAKQQPGPCAQALATLATASEDDVIRVTAAVLLRRSLPELWQGTAPEIQTSIKSTLLTALRSEVFQSVRKKLCDTVAVLASDTLQDNSWPELLPAVFELAGSQSEHERETGLYIFSQLADYATPSLEPHVEALYSIFQVGLADSNLGVSLAALRASCSIINSVETARIQQFGNLVPLMLGPISAALNSGNEDAARTGIELIIETMDYEPKFWKPHVRLVFDAMLQVASTSSLDESTRTMALEFMVSAAETLPSVCRKIPHFASSVFPLALTMMLELEDEPEWYARDDQEDDSAEYSVYDAGQEALDRLALALGGKTVLPVAFQIIPSFLSNQTSWVHRHAALLAISQIGEGCSKQIEEQLGAVLAMPLKSFADPHPRVRWAAINCVGQMCTDFGPEIQSDHHPSILPALIASMEDGTNPRVQSHAAAAVINFCDEASAEVMAPYLERLLGRLMMLLQANQRQIQEQAVTAVAAVADAAETGFTPYYDSFIPNLKKVLNVAAGQKDLRRLRGKVMECISLIGLSVGKEKFAPDAASVMDVLVRTQGQRLESDDPQSFYLMQAYARICRCLKEEFIPYLPYVMPGLLGVAEQKPDIEILGDVGDDEEDDKDDDDMETIRLGGKKIGIKTSALEDKATACSMIACFIAELKGGFIQYVEPVAQLMVPLLKFFYHDDVRSAAAGCLPDLVRSVKAQGAHMEAQTKQLVDYILPALIDATGGEPDVDVLELMIESLGDIIDLLNPGMLPPPMLNQLADLNLSLMEDRKARIEERNADALENGWDEEEVEDAREEAEKDDQILGQIANLLGALMRTQGSSGFLQSFETNLEKGSLVQASASMLAPERSAAERHAALCIFDEVLDNGGTGYAEKVLPAICAYVRDPSADVRQAAAFGLGVCAEKCGEMFAQFAMATPVWPTMEALIRNERSRDEESESATDNVVSALGKVLEFQRGILDTGKSQQATELWLSYLPIRGDAAEGVSSHARLLRFVEGGDQMILGNNLSNLGSVLRVLAEASVGESESGELTARSSAFIKVIYGQFPDATSAAIASLREDLRRRVEELVRAN